MNEPTGLDKRDAPASWRRPLALALLLGLAAAPLAADAQGSIRLRPGPPVVCAQGTSPCSGPFGQRCYAPARGEVCSQGLVCGMGTAPCVGRFGGRCYAASLGQMCTQGLVCGVGQQVCARGGYARCYSPALGESCG